MLRGLDQILASRKAFIDATASREVVAVGKTVAAGGGNAPTALQQLVPKPRHGFVGLFNQGATCYLNSFLQALYMIPEFRKAVFEFRLPDGVAPTSSVAQQLQALFIRLAYGANGATGTGALTKAFGWSDNQREAPKSEESGKSLACIYIA